MQSAPEQLRDWMRRRELNQAETAEFFGFDQTFISQLLNGHRIPSLRNAIKIEQQTGISPEAWVSSQQDSLVAATREQIRKRK